MTRTLPCRPQAERANAAQRTLPTITTQQCQGLRKLGLHLPISRSLQICFTCARCIMYSSQARHICACMLHLLLPDAMRACIPSCYACPSLEAEQLHPAAARHSALLHISVRRACTCAGSGTTFTILMPCSAADASADGSAEIWGVLQQLQQTGSGRFTGLCVGCSYQYTTAGPQAGGGASWDCRLQYVTLSVTRPDFVEPQRRNSI